MFISDFSLFTVYNTDGIYREKLRSAYEMVNCRQFSSLKENHTPPLRICRIIKKDFGFGVYKNLDNEINGMEQCIQTDTCLIIKVYI